MLRAIGRVIRDCYEMRARESSTEPYPFNTMKDPRFSSLHFCDFLKPCLLVLFIFFDILLELQACLGPKCGVRVCAEVSL
jgi:hypothetical protein